MGLRAAAPLARAAAGGGMIRLETIMDEFLPRFLSGMTVNFEIAAIALAVGLGLGLLLALARLGPGAVRAPAILLLGVMRAAPTFVVMFFLLNAIPREAVLFGVNVSPSGVMTVALSLVPYSAAYVADNGVEALRRFRAGSRLGALLFLPNVTRVFFVLVMSSSTGAAIGVHEGIAVILQFADRMPHLGDKLVLFGIGVLCFGAVLQGGFALINLLHRHLGRRVAAGLAAAQTPKG
ncbi:MAG: hypothetical protein TEF_18655 [Rhizobiales bacterium NRL2]|nr:MAG: hypothetical protein TEF_18655 [Rhizobiales bacterium NRL2]